MTQKLLLWAYVFGGFAVVWYAISAIQGFFSMVSHRREEYGWLNLGLLGLFKPDRLDTEGQHHRRQFIRAVMLLCAALIMMWLVVGIGVRTQ